MSSTKPKKRSSANAPTPHKMLLQLANDRTNPLKLLSDFTGTETQAEIRRLTENENQNIELLFRYHHSWLDLTDDQRDFITNLTEVNMREFYEQSEWGWNREAKLSEFKNKAARHLLIYDSANPVDPIAFAHFRFEEGYASDPSLYCYELQIREQYRRVGIGKSAMKLLTDLALANRMKKVLLTVLKSNEGALKFYQEGLGFTVDRNSPSKCGDKVADYEILVKRVGVDSEKKKVVNNNKNKVK